MRQTGESRE